MLQVETPVGKFRVYFTREDRETTIHLVELQGMKRDEPVEIDTATVSCYYWDTYSHFGGRYYSLKKLLAKNTFLNPKDALVKMHLSGKFSGDIPSDEDFEARRIARSIIWKAFWKNTSKKYVPSRALLPATA